jgi:multidrug efflux pump subunit AcrA (membrane-fusion protein)
VHPVTDLDIYLIPTDGTVLGPMAPANGVVAPPTAPIPVVVAPGHGPGPDDGPQDAGQRFAPGNPHARRLRGWRGLVVLAILLLAAAVLGWAISTVLLSSSLQASGVVEADQTAQLNMGTTGPIAAVDVVPGERVKAGQVLATQADTSLRAKLTADQATLAADTAALSQLQSGPTPAQRQQLQAEVTQAVAAEAAAQSKLNQTEATTTATVASAQSAVQTDQTLLKSDTAADQDEIPLCVTASPPAACGTDERQVQVDETNLANAQTALSGAQANQQAQLSAAQSGVTQAAAAVTTAQAAQAVGIQAPTAQQISSDQATIQQDQSTIAADKQAIAQTELTAPFAGVVAAVGGTVGDIATTDGVRQATSAAPVSSQSSTGIALFPQSPQQQNTKAPTTAPLIELDSPRTKIVVELPETDVSQVHMGERGTASLPAFADATFAVTVHQVLPTTVNQGGKVFVLVDLTANESAIQRVERAHPGSSDDGQVAGFTVNVSF